MDPPRVQACCKRCLGGATARYPSPPGAESLGSCLRYTLGRTAQDPVGGCGAAVRPGPSRRLCGPPNTQAPGRLRRFGHRASPDPGGRAPPPTPGGSLHAPPATSAPPESEPEPELLRQHRLRLSEARRECAVARRQLWAGRTGCSAGAVHGPGGSAGAAGGGGGAGVAGGEDEPALKFVLEQTATPHVLRLPHPPRLAAHLASSQRPVDLHLTSGCHIRPMAVVAEAAPAPEVPLNTAPPAPAASLVRRKRRKVY